MCNSQLIKIKLTRLGILFQDEPIKLNNTLQNQSEALQRALILFPVVAWEKSSYNSAVFPN